MSELTDARGGRLWVVVPAYNEVRRIGGTVARLRSAHDHVVVVDDGSRDQTAEVARAAGAIVLQHPVNLGQGAALQTGICYALRERAQYVATFDGDGQHDVADIERLLRRLVETGSDVALGSRFLGEAIAIPVGRRVLLKAAILFTALTTGLKLSDVHNGLRVFTAEAAEKLTIRQNRMAHASEILENIARHKLRYVEVPNTVRYSVETLAKGQRGSGAFAIVADLFIGRLHK